MRKCSLAFVFLLTVGWVVPAMADYACNTPDHICPTYNYTAQYDGSGHAILGLISLYSADFTDYVRLVDTTQSLNSSWFLAEPGKSGCTFNVCTFFPVGSSVKANDSLVLEICSTQLNGGSCPDSPGVVFTSNPSLSSDGENHVWLRNSGGRCEPSGNSNYGSSCSVGFEDLDNSRDSDWDYNDANMILYNVLTSAAAAEPQPVPEPASIIITVSGLLAIAGKLGARRR